MVACRGGHRVDGSGRIAFRSDHAIDRIEPARAILARGNSEALAGLSESEVETLIALLHRIIENARAGSDAPPCHDGAEPAETGPKSG